MRGLRDVHMVIEVRMPANRHVPSSPLNVQSRLFRKSSRSSGAYLRNWQRRRGPTLSWPPTHLPFLSPKLSPLQYHRASLPNAVQGALLGSCKYVGCFHTQARDYQGSIFQPCPGDGVPIYNPNWNSGGLNAHAHLQKLVELISALQTSEDTLSRVIKM